MLIAVVSCLEDFGNEWALGAWYEMCLILQRGHAARLRK